MANAVNAAPRNIPTTSLPTTSVAPREITQDEFLAYWNLGFCEKVPTKKVQYATLWVPWLASLWRLSYLGGTDITHPPETSK
jgi:hypothetical protein